MPGPLSNPSPGPAGTAAYGQPDYGIPTKVRTGRTGNRSIRVKPAPASNATPKQQGRDELGRFVPSKVKSS